ncbi:hypothetical protein IPG41_03675 [Candidatus Peregrinibacteria bacterium]|nr:MAG: hypothetical protein IPG41_03675 [Candidatus Peregrinibacteria bacterium]
MIKKYLIALMFSLMLAPAAFADEALTETVEAVETVVVSENTMVSEPMLCGGGCGYWGGVYINVFTTVSAEVDGVTLFGNYYLDNAESKEAAVEELDEVYNEIRSTLSKYGTVMRTGIYTYSDWEFTGMYDGNLSIRVDLNNPTQTEDIENILYRNGFENWREVKVSNLVAAEKAAVPTLKDLMAAKKEVYEEFLESGLGSIANLNIYSWADSTSYDPSTNMVDVMVYADVTYNPLTY